MPNKSWETDIQFPEHAWWKDPPWKGLNTLHPLQTEYSLGRAQEILEALGASEARNLAAADARRRRTNASPQTITREREKGRVRKASERANRPPRTKTREQEKARD